MKYQQEFTEISQTSELFEQLRSSGIPRDGSFAYMGFSSIDQVLEFQRHIAIFSKIISAFQNKTKQLTTQDLIEISKLTSFNMIAILTKILTELESRKLVIVGSEELESVRSAILKTTDIYEFESYLSAIFVNHVYQEIFDLLNPFPALIDLLHLLAAAPIISAGQLLQNPTTLVLAPSPELPYGKFLMGSLVDNEEAIAQNEKYNTITLYAKYPLDYFIAYFMQFNSDPRKVSLKDLLQNIIRFFTMYPNYFTNPLVNGTQVSLFLNGLVDVICKYYEFSGVKALIILEKLLELLPTLNTFARIQTLIIESEREARTTQATAAEATTTLKAEAQPNLINLNGRLLNFTNNTIEEELFEALQHSGVHNIPNNAVRLKKNLDLIIPLISNFANTLDLNNLRKYCGNTLNRATLIYANSEEAIVAFNIDDGKRNELFSLIIHFELSGGMVSMVFDNPIDLDQKEGAKRKASLETARNSINANQTLYILEESKTLIPGIGGFLLEHPEFEFDHDFESLDIIEYWEKVAAYLVENILFSEEGFLDTTTRNNWKEFIRLISNYSYHAKALEKCLAKQLVGWQDTLLGTVVFIGQSPADTYLSEFSNIIARKLLNFIAGQRPIDPVEASTAEAIDMLTEYCNCREIDIESIEVISKEWITRKGGRIDFIFDGFKLIIILTRNWHN